jgi:hypothetical protein
MAVTKTLDEARDVMITELREAQASGHWGHLSDDPGHGMIIATVIVDNELVVADLAQRWMQRALEVGAAFDARQYRGRWHLHLSRIDETAGAIDDEAGKAVIR